MRCCNKAWRRTLTYAESLNGPMAPDRKARLLANDPQALIASLQAPRGLDGAEQLLPTMTMPCLLYVGEADSYYPGALECVKHIPNAHFVSFPGLVFTDLAGEPSGGPTGHAIPAAGHAAGACGQTVTHV